MFVKASTRNKLLTAEVTLLLSPIDVAYGVEAEKKLDAEIANRRITEYRRNGNSSCNSVGRELGTAFPGRRFESCRGE